MPLLHAPTAQCPIDHLTQITIFNFQLFTSYPGLRCHKDERARSRYPQSRNSKFPPCYERNASHYNNPTHFFSRTLLQMVKPVRRYRKLKDMNFTNTHTHTYHTHTHTHTPHTHTHIYIYINRKWAVNLWQWLLCMYINMK